MTRATSVEWLDFDFSGVADAEHNYGDRELTGVDFLPTDHPARAAWREFWPQLGNLQNWDAVSWLQYADHREWLLLEAKARDWDAMFRWCLEYVDRNPWLRGRHSELDNWMVTAERAREQERTAGRTP